MKESKAIFSRRNEGEPRTASFIFEDGHTECSCGQCTPTVECEHIHPLIVEYLRSKERRDDVVEGIVEHRREQSYKNTSSNFTINQIRKQAMPRGSIVVLTTATPVHIGRLVRMLPNGMVSEVNQGPAIGIAIANSSESKVEVRVDYIPAPQPQPNSQVMMRDLEDKVLRAMQVGLPLPKLDFSIGIDYSKEMIFTAKADAVPPKPLPRRKFRL